MAKVLKSGTLAGAKGGKGHMVGKQRTGTQKPGMTSTATAGGGGKFAKGGNGHMVGKQSVRTATPNKPSNGS